MRRVVLAGFSDIDKGELRLACQYNLESFRGHAVCHTRFPPGVAVTSNPLSHEDMQYCLNMVQDSPKMLDDADAEHTTHGSTFCQMLYIVRCLPRLLHISAIPQQ